MSIYHVITLEIPQSESDVSQGILYDHGCLGLEEKELINWVWLKVYFEATVPLSQFLPSLQKILPYAQKINGTTIDLSSPIFRPITFEPLELVSGVWIIPPEDMPTETKVTSGQTIIIRPGMAFGTGRHESTQLASFQISSLKPLPQTLLDIGTGSGVLAIYARKLGIKNVMAVEIDPHARENALENFELNHLADVPLYENIEKVQGHFEVIVANIVTPTHLYLKDQMIDLLVSSGYLILSGIVREEEEEIEKAFVALEFVEKKKLNEWVSYCFRKKT